MIMFLFGWNHNDLKIHRFLFLRSNRKKFVFGIAILFLREDKVCNFCNVSLTCPKKSSDYLDLARFAGYI